MINKKLLIYISLIVFIFITKETISQVNCDDVFDFSVVYTPTICQGSNGSANINIINGSGRYMYEWSTGSIAPGISFSTAGTFAVTVTDLSNSCQKIRSFTVAEKPALNVNISSQNIKCFGQANGSATAVVSGGEEPYNYSWSTTVTTQSISQLISGNYSVVVTDVNHCTGTATVFIEEPTRFSYHITPSLQGICKGSLASLHIEAIGGTEPYTYTWRDTSSLLPDRIICPNETTIYNVTVVDANLCTYTNQSARVVVSQPINLSIQKEDVKCHGVCSGKATITSTGGIAPFNYSWDSVNSNTLNNLCAGNYHISVKDLYNCSAEVDFVISQPDTILLSISSGPPTCWGYTNGFARVVATGGVPFTNAIGNYYQYLWNDGKTQDSISVGFGNHVVTVTDANGCSHRISTFVQQPEAIYVTNPSSGTICIGEEFYTEVHATGGSSPYQFIWSGSDGSTWYGETLRVRPTTTTRYVLTTRDTNNCLGPQKVVLLKVHPVISITNMSVEPNEICEGDTVQIKMNIQGGNGGPYYITMINSGLINIPYTFYPTETGYYKVLVADACGSPTDIDSIHIKIYPKPRLSFVANRTSSCPPATILFSETSPDVGQTYLWNFGDGGASNEKTPTHTYSKSGIYTVSLSTISEYGCKKRISYNNLINIYPTPRAEFNAEPNSVSILNAEVTFQNYSEGGTEYFWHFGDSTSSYWNNDLQIHRYNTVGDYSIKLIAKNNYHCYDSITKVVQVYDEFCFYAPDAFTPNGDGKNDIFYITAHGVDKKQFYFAVYDRTGAKVFDTKLFDMKNPSRMAWDGSKFGNVNAGDKIMSNGVYKWYCEFVDVVGKLHKKTGTVTLIK